MTNPPERIDHDLAQSIISQNIEFHEAQADLYDYSHPELTHALQRLMLRRDLRQMQALLAGAPRPLAIDVGAGTGRLTLAFVRQGWDVLALDNSPAMLAVLRRRYDRLPEPKGALETVAAGADDFSPELLQGRTAQIIGFSSVLHHLPDYLGALRQMASLLPTGGLVYVTHEPLPAQSSGKTLGMRVIKVLDQLLRTPQQIKKTIVRHRKHVGKAAAAPLMDYHDEQGLDVAAMQALLETLGFETVLLKRYKDRKTALMAVLDTYIFRTPNWRFRLLARRESCQGPDAGPT
jgi:SAM-dependent methyltransferase